MNVFLYIFLLCFALTCKANNISEHSSTISLQPINIKVLLEEYNSNKKNIFNIESKEKLLIKTVGNKDNNSENRFFYQKQKLKIVIRNNNIYMQGANGPLKQIHQKEVLIKPAKGVMTLNNQPYQGIISLKFDQKQNKLFLINRLNLEDYVYSVLFYESYQTWPLEMQKVQAVISRTYAIHQILQRKRKQKYDIKRSNFHQRYNGTHKYHHLRQAVNETKGLILTYKNNVALTMFDACCGGGIPANIEGINFSKAPYLARTTPCHYCKNYSLYRWKKEIPIDTFINLINSSKYISPKLNNPGKFSDISILKRDKAGLVRTVQLTFSKKNILITGKDLWASMNKYIRSQSFHIKKLKNSILINGNGFGHQIGLCQRGARELVRKGWPMKKILNFYYPKTSLARLVVTHN